MHYNFTVTWDVEGTDDFAEWYWGLDEVDSARVEAVVDKLEELGSSIRRPLSGIIHGSKHEDMRELIPPGSNIRIFYMWDPRGIAILLVGGDKTGRWQEFYKEMTPIADELYDIHLRELRQEGLI